MALADLSQPASDSVILMIVIVVGIASGAVSLLRFLLSIYRERKNLPKHHDDAT